MLHILFHPVNPNKRDLKQVADQINKGAIVIFPTDTLYAMGCLMTQRQSIEKIGKILDKKEKHSKMSLICQNISEVAKYTQQIDNHVFRMMKKYLPGPYTFVLNSNHFVQKFFKNSRSEIGIRIPDNVILSELLPLLDAPLISTSLNTNGAETYYYNDPDEIAATFGTTADILIDGGLGSLEESTVLDCTGDEVDIVREGLGPLD